MKLQKRSVQVMAVSIAGLAGFVDSLGFMSLGGFFVSFMSGNSTRFAVSLSGDDVWQRAFIPLAIIMLFVVGVILGRVVREFNPTKPSTLVLTLTTATLFAAAIASDLGWASWAAPCMAMAMGAANNVFMRDGEVSIGVTYMTGTLVKFGQQLAGRLLGDVGSSWSPYLILWIGLVAGAVLGAISYRYWSMDALWIAVLGCLAATATMFFSE
jgi:uncharacterized membrane protein YoaK (UPF0700 family)